MRSSEHGAPPWLVWGLLGLGIVARLVPHPSNATPLLAIALFSGTYLDRRVGLWLPLIAVAISDIALGWHSTIPFTWGAFVLCGLLARRLRSHPSSGRILATTLAGSLLFFVITNFGVWLVGGIYPRTGAGLMECFIAALPFFRNSLLGDLVYVTALFGLYALATKAQPLPAYQPTKRT